ncbi:FkbM family methyltransferase [Phenylobacterium sp.]|jgi:FkbM family methyltransferase|uniref:FkbM family methyltransferase n=1 Tax=Phenylobacterium sp. TaxID=1871053 RepID=UPI0037CABFC9
MLKTAIMKTPLYPAARAVWQAMFNRDHAIHRARMGAFYSQFFEPGARVFDVGANQGEYSEIFAGEGARVVSIEPNTAYADRLKALARTNDLQPVFSAIGDAPGEAVLNVCSTPGFSTLVDRHADWIETSPDYKQVSWTTLTVPVTTLDLLASEYGEPEYVKIDVEGFEINVLRGMSFRPRYLSFEFGARRKEASGVCLAHMGEKGFQFRPIIGREYRFATPEWMDMAQAQAWLQAFSVEQAEYGDMFCHRV